jgi:hypothetical protein
MTESAALAAGTRNLLSQVVATDDEVLARGHDRTTRCWRQDVVGAKHQHARLGTSFGRQRHVDGHLVTVKVGVESCADQRMNLKRFALNQHWLEGLDAETVQRRRTVKHHWMFLDDIFENVPHLRATTLDHALGGLDVLCQLKINETLHDERLE